MWIVLPIALVVLTVVAGIAFLNRRGSIYLMGDSGYSSISIGGEPPPHHVTEAGLQTAVQRLLPGDLFDMLWISKRNDEYTGIIVILEGGSPTLSVDFKTHSEAAVLNSFTKAMAAHGYHGSEDSSGHNGGMSEQNRITAVDFTLAKSPDAVVSAIKTALTSLYPGEGDNYYLSASDTRPITEARPGVKFVPSTDPLKGIL